MFVIVFINTNTVQRGDDGVLSSIIFNDSQSKVLFSLTFASSILSASLGCSKAMMLGVASIIGDDGPFEGILSGRFVLAFWGK